MLTFDSYTKKDLQHFMQMLNQCEAKGITDIRFVREQLHKHLYKPQKIRRPVHRKNLPQIHKCPECGFAMFPVANDEGLHISGCKNCRYSEVAG